MNAAPRRVGSWWYRPENPGRANTQIAAQRWISWLIENRRITRGQKSLLDELARHIDAKRTTQKSIAFLAVRCGLTPRTVQRYLRELCPSKAQDPEGHRERILTRRFMHVLPDAPGLRADNAPSWFTLEVPERFMSPSPTRRAPDPRQRTTTPTGPRRVSSPLSPGGVENVTQAVIQGSDSTEITKSIHPCTNLAPSSSRPPSKPPPLPDKAAPLPQPLPAGGELVTLCAKLFPSHAPVAHRAVAKLRALGWTDGQIATYLRRASKDPNLAPGKADHPVWTAVWRAEKRYRSAPRLPPPAAPDEPRRTASPLAVEREQGVQRSLQGGAVGSPRDVRWIQRVAQLDDPAQAGGRLVERLPPNGEVVAEIDQPVGDGLDSDHAAKPTGRGAPIDPKVAEKIAEARRALDLVETRVGVRRRVTSQDEPPKEPKT